mgnify:CR=1 FL=1
MRPVALGHGRKERLLKGQGMTGKKVLVVDDEVHIVHVVTVKLRNHGYEVLSAENGAEALDRVLSDRPDVIVTDWHMPAMTGLEFIERIRQLPETRTIPVILLTGRSFEISPEQQQSLQITQCLSKPFSPRELLGCVDDVLCVQERS